MDHRIANVTSRPTELGALVVQLKPRRRLARAEAIK